MCPEKHSLAFFSALIWGQNYFLGDVRLSFFLRIKCWKIQKNVIKNIELNIDVAKINLLCPKNVLNLKHKQCNKWWQYNHLLYFLCFNWIGIGQEMIIFATCVKSQEKCNIIYPMVIWGSEWGEWICWAANLVFMPYAFIRMLPSFAAFLLPFFLASDSSKILSKKTTKPGLMPKIYF